MTKRPPKGTNNKYIRDAISAGLRFESGSVILPSGKVASLTPTSAGYRVIALGPSSLRKSFGAGRIICWLVHGPPPSDRHQVDHINRIRNDDRPENLRWVSASENAKNISPESRAKVLATCFKPRVVLRGEASPRARLTQAQVDEIRRREMSQNKLAAKFNTVQPHISAIQRGKIWRTAESAASPAGSVAAKK